MFHVVHQLTDTPEAVHLAACDVIKDFAADQVRYLELRTTPRHVTGSMTQRQYLDAVVRAIEWVQPNFLFFRSAQHFQESIWNYKINLFDHILISEWLNRMRSVDFMYKPEKPAITFDPLKISL